MVWASLVQLVVYDWEANRDQCVNVIIIWICTLGKWSQENKCIWLNVITTCNIVEYTFFEKLLLKSQRLH